MTKLTIDKSSFQRGEWDDEPDILEYEFDGYRCFIIRQRLGFLCGYVEVGETNELYGKEPSSVDIDVHVHGGVTFSQHHIHLTNKPWLIGFDTGHLGDMAPGMPESFVHSFNDTYKNVHYIKKEIEHMVCQIKRFEK